ncbi:MAG: hypothetical protein EOL88_04625 [Bacteroidia bacterium]|nr:hypothetical protein [Bacteroidia bacterium]
MKKTIFLCLLLVWAVATPIIAQQYGEIIIQVNLPPAGQLYPEELFQSVVLINQNETAAYLRIHATAEEAEEGLIFEATSAVFEVPTGNYYVTEQDVMPGEIQYRNQQYESYIIQTGSLPAGIYTLCLFAHDAETDLLLGEECVEHRITNSSPPELILPPNQETVTETYPIFVWNPPIPPPLMHLPEYQFTLTEIPPEMLPEEAIALHPAWIQLSSVESPFLEYPPEAREMITGKHYAWQVRSVMNGFPLGENGGFSEIFSFFYMPLINGRDIRLTTPGIDALISSSTPDYTWEPVEWDNARYTFWLWTITGEIEEKLAAGAEITYALLSDFVPYYMEENLVETNYGYPVSAPSLETEKSYYWAITATGPAGNMAESTPRRHTYRDETMAPCDTTEVNFRIRITLDSISNALCNLNSGVTDSLMQCYKSLEQQMWIRDSLQGNLDAALQFQQNLNALQGGATVALTGQISQTQSLQSDEPGCAGAWENKFYSRYVMPHPTAQRQSIYNQYVGRYNRRFEKCKQKREKWLSEDKEKINTYYNQQLKDLKAILQANQNALHDQNKKIVEQKNNLSSLQQQLLSALCQIDVHWNSFLHYLDSNKICIKCGKVYYMKPPDLQIMDHCLDSLYNKIRRKLADIQRPENQHELQEIADDYFNYTGLSKEKNQLDSLSSAFQSMVSQWNNQSQVVKLAHPCCQSPAALAGGRYLYGHQNKPYHNESIYGLRMGLGNSGMVVLPADPQNMGDPGFRSQYYQAKREFYTRRYALSKEIDKSLRKLKNGSGGTKSLINGLKDPRAVQLHGRVKAVSHHNNTADSLTHELEELLNAAANCYDNRIQNNQHRRYITLHHQCFTFKQCITLLDEAFAQYLDSLNHYRNYLNHATDQARMALAGLEKTRDNLNTRQQNLNEKINRMQNELNTIKETSVRQNIQGQLDQLKQNRNEVNQLLNNLDAQILQTKRDLHRLEMNVGSLTAAVHPRPVASVDDCEVERQAVRGAQQNAGNEARRISGLSNAIDAENRRTQTAANHISDELSRADSNATGIGSAIQEQLEEERNKEEEEKLRKERQIKGICTRLLAEYYDANAPGNHVLDSLATAYEFLSGQIDQLPGGMNEFMDQIKDFKARIDEAKETIEDIITLLSGVHGNPSNQQRTAAFAQVLKYAAEFGDRVPGFGDMISFYASAYEEAIAALYQIMNVILEPIKKVIDNETRIICPDTSWQGKTLDQIVNQLWEESFTRQSFGSLSLEQKKALESYFKQKAKIAILNCCLDKLNK